MISNHYDGKDEFPAKPAPTPSTKLNLRRRTVAFFIDHRLQHRAHAGGAERLTELKDLVLDANEHAVLLTKRHKIPQEILRFLPAQEVGPDHDLARGRQ